jgi:hypothetical protein
LWQGNLLGWEVETAAIAAAVATSATAGGALGHHALVEDGVFVRRGVGVWGAGDAVYLWVDLLHGEGTRCFEVGEGIVDRLTAVEEEIHSSWRGRVGGVGVRVTEWRRHVDCGRWEGTLRHPGRNWNRSLIQGRVS